MYCLKAFLLFLLAVCSSCSLFTDRGEYTDPIGVDLAVVETGAKASEKAIKVDKAESEKIHVAKPLKKKEKAVASKATGLILGPGLNRSVSYASLVTSLDKNDIPIHYVFGVGYSAVVASMYAAGMTGTKIEWCFHNFFNEIKDKKPFSENWNKAAVKHLVEPIPIKRIEEASKVLVLPAMDKKSGKAVFAKRGSLQEALLFNLNYFNKNKSFAPFNYLNANYFKNIGVDVSIFVNVMKKASFKGPESEFIEYEKASELIKLKKQNFDIYFDLPAGSMPLDTYENVPEVLLKSYESSNELSSIIMERLSS